MSAYRDREVFDRGSGPPSAFRRLVGLCCRQRFGSDTRGRGSEQGCEGSNILAVDVEVEEHSMVHCGTFIASSAFPRLVTFAATQPSHSPIETNTKSFPTTVFISSRQPLPHHKTRHDTTLICDSEPDSTFKRLTTGICTKHIPQREHSWSDSFSHTHYGLVVWSR